MKKSQLKVTKAIFKKNADKVILITPDMYKLIKVNSFNREKDGIEKARLKEIEQMMNGTHPDGKKWYPTANNIATINLDGVLIDATHRVTVFMKLGLPFYAFVTSDPDLNGKDIEIFKALTVINSHDSKWKKDQTSEMAVLLQMPLAVKVSDLIDDLSAKSGLSVNKIKNSWMFALLNKSSKWFSSSKELLLGDAYDNDELLAYSETEEFKKDFEYYARLVSLTKDSPRFNNVLKTILDLHWNNPVFDIERMITNIEKFGIQADLGVGDGKQEVHDVYNKGRGRRDYHVFIKSIKMPSGKREVPAYLMKK